MWQKEVALGKFERQKRAELEWGRKKFIQIKRIREVIIDAVMIWDFLKGEAYAQYYLKKSCCGVLR